MMIKLQGCADRKDVNMRKESCYGVIIVFVEKIQLSF
jgi:hypothetical protein